MAKSPFPKRGGSFSLAPSGATLPIIGLLAVLAACQMPLTTPTLTFALPPTPTRSPAPTPSATATPHPVPTSTSQPAPALTATPTLTATPASTFTPTATSTPTFTAIDLELRKVLDQVVELRGLTPLEEVSFNFMTRDELRDFLVQSFLEDYPPEEATMDREILALLSLVPPDLDLFNLYVDLYTEQVVGLYDEETKQLYVVTGEEQLGPGEKVTLAHELVHALQDQHFNLATLIDSQNNGDMELAVRTLVEGGASTVDRLYAMEFLTPEELQELSSSGGSFDVFERSPLYIQQTLVFPYASGRSFLEALLADGGWERVNEALQDPPRSTAQILHPNKYLGQRMDPVEVVLPDLEAALGAEWRLLKRDTLGELTFILLLWTRLSLVNSTIAATGWTGDRLAYLEDSEGSQLLVLPTAWENSEEAREFYETYLDFLVVKGSPTWTLLETDEGVRFWETPEGQYTYVSQEEEQVLLVLSPDEAVTREVVGLFEEPSE